MPTVAMTFYPPTSFGQLPPLPVSGETRIREGAVKQSPLLHPPHEKAVFTPALYIPSCRADQLPLPSLAARSDQLLALVRFDEPYYGAGVEAAVARAVVGAASCANILFNCIVS
jgi:hypothetical protein